jgi:hypothetical protein
MEYPSREVMQARCNALVIALVGKETSTRWWNSPNLAFEMSHPADTPIEKVYEYLMFHIHK